MKPLSKACALLACLFVTPGCTETQVAAAFNEQIVASLKRLQPAGEHFYKRIGPAIAGQPVDMDDVRGAHKAAQDTVAAIRADSKTWKVPARASSRDLFASFEKVLDTEEEIITRDFAAIVKILEDPTPPAPEKAQKIEQVLKGLDGRDETALAELHSAQAAFARDYNLKLQNK